MFSLKFLPPNLLRFKSNHFNHLFWCISFLLSKHLSFCLTRLCSTQSRYKIKLFMPSRVISPHNFSFLFFYSARYVLHLTRNTSLHVFLHTNNQPKHHLCKTETHTVTFAHLYNCLLLFLSSSCFESISLLS